MKDVGGRYLVFDSSSLQLDLGPGCLESPDRLSLVEEAFDLEEFAYPPLVCTPEHLTLFHSPGYIRRIEDLCQDLGEGEVGMLDEDTRIVSQSYQAARHAVGSALRAAELARRGYNSFALVRPPGHHAYEDHSAGFCLFNNIAIASEYLRQKGEKILIIDIDLHLGDGTMQYAAGRDGVFFFSLNHENLWPYVHPEDARNTLNIPLPDGTADEKYIATLHHNLVPIINTFKPSIIAVSAGFDTHGTDLLYHGETLKGGFQLTDASYKYLWRLLNTTLLPHFAVLEGGYNPLSVSTGVTSFFEVK